MSATAAETFQEHRNPRNPKDGNTFGLATTAIFVICVLAAIILGIFAVLESDKLRTDHEAIVAELQEEIRKIESSYSSETEGLVQSGSLNAMVEAGSKANVTQLSRLVQLLIKVAAVPDSQKKPAHVPHAKVYTALNHSATFSCETDGQPLSSCLWTRPLKGRHQIIIIDDHTTVPNGGQTSAEGISYVGAGLVDGKCTIRIESLARSDVGSWSCTLVSRDGVIYNGAVSMKSKKPTFSIFFATAGGGLKVYSLETSRVRTVGNSSAIIAGVTYDSINDKIYWCSASSIYRANEDGTELETVSSAYSGMQGLAFDWIAGNLYVVTSKGDIIACDTSLAKPFTCAVIATGQGDVEGVALHPSEGTMYYTRFTPSPSIVKAGMDGSNPVTVVSDIPDAYGIAIDYEASQLYWADKSRKHIQSSNLQGDEIRTEVLFPVNGPYGMALFNGTKIWGTFDGHTLQQQRSTQAGTIIRTLYTGSHSIRHVTVAPPYSLPTDRANHCAGKRCSKVCVLTTDSFRCVS